MARHPGTMCKKPLKIKWKEEGKVLMIIASQYNGCQSVEVSLSKVQTSFT